jgi:hypothetical protein
MSDEIEQSQYVRPRDPEIRRRGGQFDPSIDGENNAFADAFDVSDPIEDTAVDIFYLLDSLEELVSIGKRFPFSGKVMVDENEFLALVDQLRIAVPNEIKQAQRVIRERQAIISEAHGEAVRILDAARTNAEYFVSEDGVLQEARLKGEAILQSAEQERNYALGQIDAYALEQFEKVERAMRQGLALIEESLADAEQEMRIARDNVGI